jgi:hypothetical protein
MKPPACDPGDFCMAQRAESTLFIPEIAKSAGTPKRFQHVSPFPFLPSSQATLRSPGPLRTVLVSISLSLVRHTYRGSVELHDGGGFRNEESF